jgi:aryl-alcohol dehydrogenase-like predicted oxidoreductase
MLYKTLGKSTLNISKIGFGCMSLKDNQAENEKIIHKAIDEGINYFDTADLYDKGRNEASLGQAIKGKRDKVIIATKVGNQWRNEGSGWDWNPSKKYILTAIEGSLQRLQTDYVDLYQLHGGTMEDPIDETIEAFEQLQKEGKIRYYGISSIRPNVIREYIKRSNIVSVMMQYSLLDRRPEETILELLKEFNIGVLARGSVASGLLVNKPPKPYLNYVADEVSKAVRAVNRISSNNRNSAQTAIRYVLENEAITAAIVGIRTMEQLEEAIKTIKTPKLTSEEIATLINALPANTYDQHR